MASALPVLRRGACPANDLLKIKGRLYRLTRRSDGARGNSSDDAGLSQPLVNGQNVSAGQK